MRFAMSTVFYGPTGRVVTRIESPDMLLATYHVRAPWSDALARASALAIEQSVEVPLEALKGVEGSRIKRDIVAHVEAIRRMEDGFEVVLGLAEETTGYEISQLINMLYGNCSMHDDVELVDVELPDDYASHFPGPQFGIDGIRRLTGASGRALTCTAIKPQGSTIAHLVDLARTFALAGIDVIKDDHGLADQSFSPFAERVPLVQRAVEQANRETGGHTQYAPTFSGGPKAITEQLRVARDCGVTMAMVVPMLVGLPVFREMRDEFGIPLLAHPSFTLARCFSPALLIGKIYRMLGADAVIFPNHGSRFAYSRETCSALVGHARRAWAGYAVSLPVPGGGMTPARVDEAIDEYGIDTMLLVGGGLLIAADPEDPSVLLSHCRAFVDRVASHASRV